MAQNFWLFPKKYLTKSALPKQSPRERTFSTDFLQSQERSLLNPACFQERARQELPLGIINCLGLNCVNCPKILVPLLRNTNSGCLPCATYATWRANPSKFPVSQIAHVDKGRAGEWSVLQLKGVRIGVEVGGGKNATSLSAVMLFCCWVGCVLGVNKWCGWDLMWFLFGVKYEFWGVEAFAWQECVGLGLGNKMFWS